MIEIKQIYSWYDILVDGVMVLHHLNRIDVNDIIKVCKETNTQYKVIRGE